MQTLSFPAKFLSYDVRKIEKEGKTPFFVRDLTLSLDFQTFKFTPSPELAKVLGEMKTDDLYGSPCTVDIVFVADRWGNAGIVVSNVTISDK